MPHNALILGATTEFLTIKALGTFTGASVATVAVGNGLRHLLGWDVLWLPFGSALGFSALQSQVVGADWSDVATYVLIIVNGFLLFFTALGANQAGVAAKQGQDTGRVKQHGRKRQPVVSSWL